MRKYGKLMADMVEFINKHALRRMLDDNFNRLFGIDSKAVHNFVPGMGYALVAANRLAATSSLQPGPSTAPPSIIQRSAGIRSISQINKSKPNVSANQSQKRVNFVDNAADSEGPVRRTCESGCCFPRANAI